ncbi:hypothetical protein [Tersicoccus sp. Bi-70]|uniref:hypothetical protein n=1 Tax=Tersicoccus sp. Bi-70 TaxID=1897634 RepID=UPI000975CB4A|nr:hypothetical protein [Tersicoccus sp. Bi-70]OMH35007.1 hypothetical protein BGP79_01280 [Tersicoccus sp. Bi-70]
MAHRRADARPTRTVDAAPPGGGTAGVEPGAAGWARPSTPQADPAQSGTVPSEPTEDTRVEDDPAEDAERVDPVDAADGSGPPLAALRLDRILAAEDDPRGWGGRGDDAAPDHDRWLREQRPPHWS